MRALGSVSLRGGQMIWNKEYECMSRENLQDLQLRRLKKVTHRVFERLPFYKRKFEEERGKFERERKKLEERRKELESKQESIGVREKYVREREDIYAGLERNLTDARERMSTLEEKKQQLRQQVTDLTTTNEQLRDELSETRIRYRPPEPEEGRGSSTEFPIIEDPEGIRKYYETQIKEFERKIAELKQENAEQTDLLAKLMEKYETEPNS